MKNILLFGLFLSCLFLNAQISVTATAGSSTGYYTNLKGAFDAINSGNHQGYINISINANTTETTTAVLNDVSTYNSITIKPTTTATVSGSVDSNPLIKILGSNVLIDGSASATGNSRDLTISNISTINPSVIHMGSANSNAPLKFVTLRNTILSNANNNGSNLVIANGESVPDAGFFSNLAITNNDFRGGSNGIYINADPTVTYIENSLQISNNLVGNNIIQNGIFVSGFKGSTSIINNNISIIRTTNGSSGLPAVSVGVNIGLGTNQSTISGNTISVKNTSTYYAGYNQLTGIYISPGASNISTQINNNTINEVSGILVTLASAGIYVTEATSNVKIFSNKISGLKNTNQGNTPISGIVLGSSSNTANTLIYNNVIYDILGYGLVNGIYIFSGGGYKIYHNTINLINTTAVNYSGPSNALHISSNVTIPNSLDIRNNFFIINWLQGPDMRFYVG